MVPPTPRGRRRSTRALPPPSEGPRPWTDAYPPGVPTTYRYPDVPLGRLLSDAVRDFPSRAALVHGDTRIDHRELADRVARTAGALRALGVGRGTRVATLLPNTPDAVAVPFAVWRLGGIVVTLDVRHPGDLLRSQLRNAGVEVVVATPARAHEVAGRAETLPALRHVVLSRPPVAPPATPGARLRQRLDAGRLRRGARDEDLWLPEELPVLHDLITGIAPVTTDLDLPASQPAVVAHTRGRTGAPRPAVLTHGNLVANAFQARLWVPDVHAGAEVVLAALPFSHLYGFTIGMLQTVLSAGTAVLLDDPTDGHAALAAVQRHRVTLVPGLPRMFADVVAHPEVGRYDLTSVRACLSGGAPLAPEVAARFEAITGGARLRNGFGVTEAGPLTHANPIYGRYRATSIGLPVTDTAALIVDPTDPRRVLGPGEVGELLVAGPQLGPGYWPHEDRGDEDVSRVDGWLRTGDLAAVDADGWFTLAAPPGEG